MMYELYISPEKLSGEEMDVLGDVTKWAEANAHPLLDNTTMVGGDPAQREPYGYVHSNAEKSIVMLRNPFVRPRTMKLKINGENGFKKFEGKQRVEIMYPDAERVAEGVKFGDTLTLDLNAYEQLVAQMAPGRADEYSGIDRLPTGTPQPLALTPAKATKVQIKGEDLISLHAVVDVPKDYLQARLAILVEPDGEVRGIKAEAVDSGVSMPLSVENGGRGNWYWYYADLAPGKHTIDVTIHTAPAGSLSAWLLTRRDTGITGYSTIIPPRHNIERRTHLLLEETIR
jgi:hypothetical protein